MEMAKLMHYDVINNPVRCQDDLPVKLEVSLAVTASPSA